MNVIPIRFEGIIAGAILNFGSVDEFDLALLCKYLESSNLQLVDGKKHLSNYFVKDKEVIRLKDGLTLDDNVGSEEKPFSLGKYLEMIAEPELLEFYTKLDILEFVLKKIKLMNQPSMDRLAGFNALEKFTIEQLVNEGYLVVRWNNDIPYEDYEEITLTKKGEVYLFKKTYPSYVETLKESLRTHKYDETLFDDYLLTQDLARILSFDISSFLESFVYYCNVFDRSICK